MILLLTGCMTLDPFFFNGERVSQYGFPTDIERLEEVAFTSGDGTQLYGAWAWQAGQARHSTVLYFHGNAANMDHYWPQVEAIYEAGYNVFTFDYRGFGRSEGDSTHDGLLLDGVAAVDATLQQTPWLDGADELAFVGLSLGGFVGLHTAVERAPGALVTQDMFASAEDLVELNTGMDYPAGWLVEEGFDNVGAAGQLEGVPYLLMHGSDDTYIKPDNAHRVYEAAQDPKRLWLVPGAGHADTHEVALEDYQRELVDWLGPPEEGDTGSSE